MKKEPVYTYTDGTPWEDGEKPCSICLREPWSDHPSPRGF